MENWMKLSVNGVRSSEWSMSNLDASILTFPKLLLESYLPSCAFWQLWSLNVILGFGVEVEPWIENTSYKVL